MSADQLCEAAKAGLKENVTQFIKAGVDVNAAGGDGRTALHWSVDRTKFAVVKELLDLQARIDVVDGQGESPIHIAVRNCQGANDTIGKMMVSVLLQRYTGPKRQLVDMQSVSGDTATHIAVRAGNEAVLRAIIKHKPNLDLPNNAGETARSLAAQQPAIIQELLANGGNAPAGGGAAAPAPASASTAGMASPAAGSPVNTPGGAQPPPKNRKPPGMATAASSGPPGPVSGLSTVGRGRPMPNVPGGGPPRAASAAAAPGEAAKAYDKSEFNNVQSRQLDMPTHNLAARGASAPGGDQGRASEVGGVQESLQNLQAHIKRLFETEGFEEEFDYLEKMTAAQIQNEDFSTALQAHNKDKNRYTNILPFERTRVVLGPVEGLVGSDYINASFMSGEVPGSQNAYIAAQGPKEVTVFDFWRMVYELKLSVIVMLGNNIEDGKIKFWQYWPEDFGAIDIGYFRVTYVSQESFFGEVYLRRYLLTNTYTNEQAEICHLKYTAFPDHGVPDNTNGFLKLISLAEEEAVRLGEKRGIGRKAVVVHCVPEDHEILTERGFMDLDAYERAVAAGESVRVAGFDAATQQMRFEAPRRLVKNERAAQTLVEFAPASSHEAASLLVTPGHDMYVQTGVDGVSTRAGHRKVVASELLNGQAARHLAVAAGGVGGVGGEVAEREYAHALGLQSAEQEAAFLEAYGVWLGNGSLLRQARSGEKPGVAICINARTPADAEFLQATLARAGLADSDWDLSDNGALVRITNARWVDFFLAQYGHKYDFDEDGSLSKRRRTDAGVDARGVPYDAVSWAGGSYMAPESAKSAKWFWHWVWTLDKARLRHIVRGLWRADGDKQNQISTESARFRDELVRVLLMAGYSARFAAAKRDAWAVLFAEPGSDEAACAPTTAPARERAYTGRTWCFEMPSGFIMTRRAHKSADGVVTEASRPIITGNCSAGVGRTGTFIAVAITIAKLNYASTATIHGRPPLKLNFNVLDTLVQLRRQRPGMVQTKEQLIFCFPAGDHQLLTNRGFMFVDQVLHAVRWHRDAASGRVVVDDWRGLRVASYDAAAARLVYRAPNALVLNESVEQRVLEFGAWGKPGAVSLAVTDGHEMYVRLPGDAAHAKVRADRVVQLADRVHMLALAANGVGACDGAAMARLAQTLGVSDAEPMLELYGVWLASGARADSGGVSFACADDDFLRQRLAQLGVDAVVAGRTVRVCVPAWARLFAGAATAAAQRDGEPPAKKTAAAAPSSSAARLATWLRDEQLPAHALASVVRGMQQCDDACVTVDGAALRDDVVKLLLDAGFSATFAAGAGADAWRVYYSAAGAEREPIVAVDRDRARTALCTTWCFDMSSGAGLNDGFVVARRARRADGDDVPLTAPAEQWRAQSWLVSEASRATIQGNCYLAILEKVITHCNILDFQNERWFNKISAHEAINVLTAGKNGSFLFRPSSAPGYLSMSYNKDQVIHHVRIQVTSDGFICEGDEIIYTSLGSLVSNKAAVLQHPIFAF